MKKKNVDEQVQGWIQDLLLGGGALKKNCAERREARNFWGYFAPHPLDPPLKWVIVV